MASLAAALLAVAKAVPAAERLMSQVVDLYVAWKLNENRKSQLAKDARNDALVDGAGAAVRVRGICPTCGADTVNGAGQYGGAGETPAVRPSGGSGT